MSRIIAPNYEQRFLLPPSLEDWVPEDHPARFLREFVESLNLAELGFTVPAALEGRPPYAPSLLLKIWLYGYYHRIRSTRKLEAACREHLSLLWLTGMIQPDHNSLWRFWRDNKKALRAVFKQTVKVAAQMGAVGMVVQAVDGTKIEAAASRYSGWSKEKMEKLLSQLDAVLDETELKIVEEGAGAPENSYRLPAGLAQRQALREEIRKGLAQLEADERKHYHPVEPEARRMKAGLTTPYAYNAQAVADGQTGIIVANDVTRQETDGGQLVGMIEQARENLDGAAQDAVTLADSGYGAGPDIQAAAQKGMTVLTTPAEGKPSKGNPFAAQHFKYDAATQTLVCPQGRRLDFQGATFKKGMPVRCYRCHHKDCPARDNCSKDANGRQVDVWPYTPEVQRMRDLLRQGAWADLLRKRREIIERCFGQIKQHDGFRRWTVWGLDAVRTQWAILCATSNLRTLHKHWTKKIKTAAAVGVVFEAKGVFSDGLTCRLTSLHRLDT